MLVCHVAGIKKDDTVLDLCAAPGGKSLHAADIATKGKVIARDVSEKKLAAIRDNVNRCGFTNIEVVCGDATNETLLREEGIADTDAFVFTTLPNIPAVASERKMRSSENPFDV